MYKQAKPFFMIVQTPLHAGSGQDLGIVDMPIQRERHTSFPKIEGSSLKGAIREVFDDKKGTDIQGLGKIDDSSISLSFGPENGDDHAGALGFTDARLLLFPVKSMKGVFAYITCPYVLERFKEDLVLCFGKEAIKDITCESVANGECYVSSDQLKVNTTNIILEEYTFKVQNGTDNTQKLAKHLKEKIGVNEIENKLVILSNDDFKDFVNLSTEVITRIKISPETGTVQPGALFTEEYLPAESVLYSLALTTPIFMPKDEEKGIFSLKVKENGNYKENPNLQNLATKMNKKKEDIKEEDIKEEDIVMFFFTEGLPDVMQIGGNATIGKGIVRTAKWNGGN